MLTLLPIICFFCILLVLRKFLVLGWRSSFLFAALLWGLLLTGVTELLSLLRWLDFGPVASTWGIVSLLLLFFIFVVGNQKLINLQLHLHHFRLSRFELLMLVYLILVIIVIGVIAWVAPPNTWDSMTYHMGRIIHWIQNKSVAFYPTHILRQLFLNPWAEYAILHFQILGGNDRFANFIQWFSMIGSIVGVSLLAEEYKATTRGQIFAAVVCATIPMGILQGSSTQNDYAVSFWLVCFVYFATLLRKKANLLHAVGTGAALGLAMLTKATAYVYAIPFLAYLGLSSIKLRRDPRIALIVLVLVIAFVPNIGFLARNYNLFGNPLGPGQDGAGNVYANEIFSLSALTSNIIRNLSLHMDTPYSQVNIVFENAISSLHKLINISPNDARTTWPGEEFHIEGLPCGEASCGNPLHLIIVTLSVVFFISQRPRDREIVLYILQIILAFLLFCVYLKWQPWHSRLHLPLFVLSAPLVGIQMSRIRDGRIPSIFLSILMVTALPWVIYNPARPVLGKNSIFTTNRMEQYFNTYPSLADPYIESAQFISGLNCSDVGLDISFDRWEYPLWIFLRGRNNPAIRLEHVNVVNISRQTQDENHPGSFSPCAIFSDNVNPPDVISMRDTIFLRKWSSGSFSVYTGTSSP